MYLFDIVNGCKAEYRLPTFFSRCFHWKITNMDSGKVIRSGVALTKTILLSDLTKEMEYLRDK